MKQYRLGDICRVHLGVPLGFSDYKESGFPVLKPSGIEGGYVSKDIVFYCDPEKVSAQKLVKFGDIVISRFKNIRIGINLTDTCYLFSSSIFKVEPNLEIVNKKYLYYLLLNHLWEIENSVTTGNITFLNRDPFLKINVSVPDLETQSKIVKCLDTIAELRREINREISLRDKQYEFYRRYLITNPHSAK